MKHEVDTPILVTGCPRSGTSIVSGMLEICGAFVGACPIPSKKDTRGLGENIAIYEKVVKPYLHKIHVDPAGQWPLPAADGNIMPAQWNSMVESAIIADGYTQGKWAYKSSTAALIWKIWHFAFPNAKWLIVRRRTGDIVSSCLQTAHMKAFRNKSNRQAIGIDDETMAWTYWVRKYEEFFVQMVYAGLNCKIIWPERFIRGDYTQLYEIIEWTGLSWNSNVANFIDPKLWKTDRKEG